MIHFEMIHRIVKLNRIRSLKAVARLMGFKKTESISCWVEVNYDRQEIYFFASSKTKELETEVLASKSFYLDFKLLKEFVSKGISMEWGDIKAGGYTSKSKMPIFGDAESLVVTIFHSIMDSHGKKISTEDLVECYETLSKGDKKSYLTEIVKHTIDMRMFKNEKEVVNG